jgi:hypothetical protein
MSEATPAKPLEKFVRELLHEAETMAHREPAKAIAMAFGIGLLFHVLPKRLLVAGATATALTLLKPALLTFGVVKAAELVLSQTKKHSEHEQSY